MLRDEDGRIRALPQLEHVLDACLDAVRAARAADPADGRLDWNRVKLYMQKHGFDLETFYDRAGEADEVYGVKATSTVIVVDKAGKIVYAGAGGDQDIESAVKRAL